MKIPAILPAFFAILISLVGCERRATPVTVGPFEVNSETGVATGKAFVIEFNVAGATGADVTSELAGSPESTSRAEITLADDLKINLQTTEGCNAVTFELNDHSFGALERGSKVEIETDRSVMVNGEKRTVGDRRPE